MNSQLSHYLAGAQWLDGDFSAGDLVMAGVLARLKGHQLLEEFANLCAYLSRAEARPAYQAAFAAQLAAFTNGRVGGV